MCRPWPAHLCVLLYSIYCRMRYERMCCGGLSFQRCQQGVELVLVRYEHLAWLAALGRADDAGFLELIHEPSCAVVAYGVSALYHARAALLGRYHRACCLLEVRVEAAYVA